LWNNKNYGTEGVQNRIFKLALFDISGSMPENDNNINDTVLGAHLLMRVLDGQVFIYGIPVTHQGTKST
jgi:hypothetical protein